MVYCNIHKIIIIKSVYKWDSITYCSSVCRSSVCIMSEIIMCSAISREDSESIDLLFHLSSYLGERIIRISDLAVDELLLFQRACTKLPAISYTISEIK